MSAEGEDEKGYKRDIILLLDGILGIFSCFYRRRSVQDDGAEGSSGNALNDTAESESIENIMEEVERMSREVKEGKEEGKKVSENKKFWAHHESIDVTSNSILIQF